MQLCKPFCSFEIFISTDHQCHITDLIYLRGEILRVTTFVIISLVMYCQVLNDFMSSSNHWPLEPNVKRRAEAFVLHHSPNPVSRVEDEAGAQRSLDSTIPLFLTYHHKTYFMCSDFPTRERRKWKWKCQLQKEIASAVTFNLFETYKKPTRNSNLLLSWINFIQLRVNHYAFFIPRSSRHSRPRGCFPHGIVCLF